MFVYSKKNIALFILVSLLSATLFSFMVMTHRIDGSMPGNCPFSAGTALALCPSSTLNNVIHNISAYYTLVNVPIISGVMMFIVFIFAYYTILRHQISSIVFEVLYSNLNLNIPLYKRITNRWLSLLENSPSF